MIIHLKHLSLERKGTSLVSSAVVQCSEDTKRTKKSTTRQSEVYCFLERTKYTATTVKQTDSITEYLNGDGFQFLLEKNQLRRTVRLPFLRNSLRIQGPGLWIPVRVALVK